MSCPGLGRHLSPPSAAVYTSYFALYTIIIRLLDVFLHANYSSLPILAISHFVAYLGWSISAAQWKISICCTLPCCAAEVAWPELHLPTNLSAVNVDDWLVKPWTQWLLSPSIVQPRMDMAASRLGRPTGCASSPVSPWESPSISGSGS